jgi:hypothetical protein
VARPGARFQCHNDGFCCRDFYALGPIDRSEKKRLGLFRPGLTFPALTRGEHALAVTEDGSCVLLDGEGCVLHRELGFRDKPRVCRRFPFGISATPLGGRVTTSHRCTCRTLGERRPVDVADAETSLTTDAGRLLADHRVGQHIAIDDAVDLPFGAYVELEQQMIEALLGGEAPLDAIAAQPEILPELVDPLTAFALELMAMGQGPRRVHLAARWCSGALQRLLTGGRLVLEEPFWNPEFDRVMQRCPREQSAREMLADWLADELWSLTWVRFGSLARARVAWTLWLMAADVLVATRVEAGYRQDRAAAEAIAALELLSALPRWWELIRSAPLAVNLSLEP